MNRLKYIFTLVLVVLVTAFHSVSPTLAYVSVKGYYRNDGTYVRPHVRSNPNGLKWDNYSYTPSQGLFNDTYGTRGSTWDTPTYLTDPDYYVGKSLYESKTYTSLPSLPSYSSPSYSLPKYTMPTYTLPTYTLPTYTLPSYTLPTYTLPTYSFSRPTTITPLKTTPTINLGKEKNCGKGYGWSSYMKDCVALAPGSF